MANRKTSGNTYKGAIIDTAPGASGYWTDAVKASDHRVGAMYLSLSGIWAGTVYLQYRESGAPGWTIYRASDGTALALTANTRQIIEDYTNCEYRAGVLSGGYTSGAIRVRIDYHDGESR